MLLEYGLRNFTCFEEGAEISFKLPKSCPENISLGKSHTNILGIKGKNGSGKTNILKGLSFLNHFCTNSFSYKPDEAISIDNFYDNDSDSEFYIEFKENDVTYLYEVVLNEESVVRETLFRTEQRKSKIIERIGKKFTTLTSEFKILKSIKLRKNASFISIVNQYEFDNISTLDIVYNFFDKIISNVTFFGLFDHDLSMNVISEIYSENPKIFGFVKKLIQSCDTGVKDIQISSREDDDEKDKRLYFPIFIHEVDGKEEKIFHYSESSGTNSLYKQLGKYHYILSSGGVLCLDEFDINLHPHILPLLLDLFTDSSVNTKDAQIIFTTHNTEILDYLGKYRSYIVEKIDNKSFVFRLDDIDRDFLRNDRSIIPIYNAGKIGGVPNL